MAWKKEKKRLENDSQKEKKKINLFSETEKGLQTKLTKKTKPA